MSKQPVAPVPSLKLGRLAPYPESVKPRLKLAKYLTLPAPPTAVDWYSKVPAWGMMLNDTLGDCTVAEVGHQILSASVYGSAPVVINDAQILSAYEDISGYQPGNPDTDNGAVIQDVLGYWRRVGIGGHRCLAFAQVAVSDHTEVQQAILLFGSIDLGLNVPQSAVDQFNAGQPWEVIADDGGIAGGHSVEGVGYRWTSAVATDPTGVWLVTWGAVTHMSWSFWDRYVEEAWIVVLPEWLNAQGVDPQGIDLYALGQDLSALVGEPNPFPSPTPVPTPLPPSPTPTPPSPTVGCAVSLLAALALVALARRR